jgi:DNA-binding Xre family transcriptional regulator
MINVSRNFYWQMLSFYDNILLEVKMRLYIKETARERGWTLARLGRKLGVCRANMSAINSGRRGVSLAILIRISRLLDCRIDELVKETYPEVFANKKLTAAIGIIEHNAGLNLDKSWVHRIILAHKEHYEKKRIL